MCCCCCHASTRKNLRCLLYALCTFNWVGAVILGALGVVAFTSPNYVFVITATAIFLTTFFGCCGAQQESKCHLRIFGSFMICTLVGLAICCFFGFDKDNQKAGSLPAFLALLMAVLQLLAAITAFYFARHLRNYTSAPAHVINIQV
ncbi:uncharacterized protein LOC132197013 [Neocloeon triangulifer]|uniref:uncharacterized protein LOC132197013 n=1 Tax=Neocloeon triangulifer TaxID=2078957 RepID=UPI00286FA777|nr:uncharacterized protein LOC132197013 [Neocloeon triangulifer]